MSRFFALLSLASLLVAGHVADASVIIEIINTPLPTVPLTQTRIEAIDYQTGQVAFSRVVDGSIQSATLSDGDEAAYSLAEAGSSLFSPKSSLFVQRIGDAPSGALLFHDGPIYNLGLTEARLVWQDYEAIKVRSRADGTTQSLGGSNSTNVQISGSRLLWHNWSGLGINQYHVQYVDLDTGDYSSHLFWNRPIQSLALPRHQPGSGGGAISVVYSPLAISGGRVYADIGFGVTGGSLVSLYDQFGTPFTVRSLKTNGEQMVFKDSMYREIDDSTGIFDSSLYLSNAGNIIQLSGPQSDAYALGPHAVAWTELADSVYSLFVHDIASGQTHLLPIDARNLYLWDMNGRYVLVTSEIIPEPATLLLVGLAPLFLVIRPRGARRSSRAMMP